MNLLFKSADRYLAESDWKDLALVKFCLFAMGLLVGTAFPEKDKPVIKIVAGGVFLATYLSLMAKYLGILTGMTDGETETVTIPLPDEN